MPHAFSQSCVLPASRQSTSCSLSLADDVSSSGAFSGSALSRDLSLTASENLTDHFADGILIVTVAGEWISASDRACQMCNRLEPNVAQQKKLPKVIKRVCQIAAGNYSHANHHANHHAIGAEFELPAQYLPALRIRVLPIQWPSVEQDCLLVILEDSAQSAQRLAYTESHLYRLTQRETEVWHLFRAEQSRKEMAGALFITAATVKKHMRNILGKKQAFLDSFYTA